MHHFWNLSKDMHKGGIYDLKPEELAKRDAYREDAEAFLDSGESIFVEERLRQMATRWNRRTSKAAREGAELFGDSFLQLRYEDLLLRPEQIMQPVFELLGAQADKDVVSRCVQKNSFQTAAGRPRGDEESESFFRKGVAGDWRTLFTKSDRDLYEQIAGHTLVEMGYPLD